MKLISKLISAYNYLRGPTLPSEAMSDLYSLLAISREIDINYFGGPHAAILVHGIGDGNSWNEFKIKHRGSFVMEVCNETLYPGYGANPLKIGFSFYIHATKLSKADVEFIGAVALSKMVEETNFLPYSTKPRLQDTACKYIKKFSISNAALYCIKCK